jgi:hypothetical protein
MATITAVLLDRFFGMLATVTIGFVAFLIAKNEIGDPNIGTMLYWFMGLILVGLGFVVSRRFSRPAKAIILKVFPARLKERVTKLFDALDIYRTRRADFFLAFVYSVIAQAIFIAVFYLLARSIDIELSILSFFLLMPIVTLFSMTPSIGGLGVREMAIVYLFKSYVSKDQAIALALLFDLFIYGIGVGCGILYALRGGATVKEMEKIEEGN